MCERDVGNRRLSGIGRAACGDGVGEADDAAVGAGAVTEEQALVLLLRHRVRDLARERVAEADDVVLVELGGHGREDHELLRNERHLIEGLLRLRAGSRLAREVGGDGASAARHAEHVAAHRHDAAVLARDAVGVAEGDQGRLEHVGDEEAASRVDVLLMALLDHDAVVGAELRRLLRAEARHRPATELVRLLGALEVTRATVVAGRLDHDGGLAVGSLRALGDLVAHSGANLSGDALGGGLVLWLHCVLLGHFGHADLNVDGGRVDRVALGVNDHDVLHVQRLGRCKALGALLVCECLQVLLQLLDGDLLHVKSSLAGLVSNGFGTCGAGHSSGHGPPTRPIRCHNHRRAVNSTGRPTTGGPCQGEIGLCQSA